MTNHWASWLTPQTDSSIASHMSVVVLNGTGASLGYPGDSRSIKSHWQWSFLFILRKVQTKFIVGIFFYPTLRDCRNDLSLRRVPRLLFFDLVIRAICHKQYRVLVEGYWQRKTKVIGEKCVPVSFCTTQILHVVTWNRTQASEVARWWIMASDSCI